MLEYFYTGKQVGEVVGLTANRVYYLTQDGVLIPSKKKQKGNNQLTYHYYDQSGVLEAMVVKKLSDLFIPRRQIKAIFDCIRKKTKKLDPFFIYEQSRRKRETVIYLCRKAGGKWSSCYSRNRANESSNATIAINLTKIVRELRI